MRSKIMKNIRKSLMIIGFLFCVLIFNGCQMNRDGMLRRNPYTKEEFEAYLEEKYGEEFTILSRTEIYSLNALQKVEYEVQWDGDTDVVFQANDLHSGGAAGWGVNDEWEQVLEDYESDAQSNEKE